MSLSSRKDVWSEHVLVGIITGGYRVHDSERLINKFMNLVGQRIMINGLPIGVLIMLIRLGFAMMLGEGGVPMPTHSN